MRDSILVAYATRHGSTQGVAEAIGKVFSKANVRTDVRPAGEVDDLSGCRAVVLGSPICAGKWLPDAVSFAKKHREELASMPVALFVVGLTMCMPSEKNVQKVIAQTKPMVELLHPTDVGLFAGALDYADLGFFDRLQVRMMKIPQGDFRNWKVIRKWASDVLVLLTKEKQ